MNWFSRCLQPGHLTDILSAVIHFKVSKSNLTLKESVLNLRTLTDCCHSTFFTANDTEDQFEALTPVWPPAAPTVYCWHI